jgi:hypothetical protein
MAVAQCVAVVDEATGKEAEDVDVSLSVVEVGLVMVAWAGRVVDDPLSWIVTVNEICWIGTAPLIATASACLTGTEIAMLFPCEIESEIVKWTGVIDLSVGTSGKFDVQIVRIVTGLWSLGNAIVLPAEQIIVAQLPRLSPPHPMSPPCQVRHYQIACLSTIPPNKRTEKHPSSPAFQRRIFDVIVIDQTRLLFDLNLPRTWGFWVSSLLLPLLLKFLHSALCLHPSRLCLPLKHLLLKVGRPMSQLPI